VGVSISLQSFHHGILGETGDGRHCANYFDREDAHPRVTGRLAEHKAFHTIEDARVYMMGMGISKCKEVIQSTADTTPEKNNMAYYAVAHGANPGIRKVW
jgi:viroplasmin and RNaseH domain-containing protein